jgi:hypothetical protein
MVLMRLKRFRAASVPRRRFSKGQNFRVNDPAEAPERGAPGEGEGGMADLDFHDRLLSGEKILWSGRPAQGLLLTQGDWIMIPFSLFWGGFSIFWVIMAMASRDRVFPLFGLPFVAIGIYLILGRFFFDAWIRRGVVYAVTNKRILISRGGPFASFTTLALEDAARATMQERANGSGTIRFGPVYATAYGGRAGFSSWAPSLDPTPQFLAIENVRDVFQKIQNAAEAKA